MASSEAEYSSVLQFGGQELQGPRVSAAFLHSSEDTLDLALLHPAVRLGRVDHRL
jgi:hypothetical protein